MTFEKFLEKKKVKLKPWQREAAAAFLIVVRRHRHSASGKTFIIRELDDYISQHGNEFEV